MLIAIHVLTCSLLVVFVGTLLVDLSLFIDNVNKRFLGIISVSLQFRVAPYRVLRVSLRPQQRASRWIRYFTFYDIEENNTSGYNILKRFLFIGGVLQLCGVGTVA